jgi:hypothetical protein
MKLGYQTNTWGGVVGHPAGVTCVKDKLISCCGPNPGSRYWLRRNKDH